MKSRHDQVYTNEKPRALRTPSVRGNHCCVAPLGCGLGWRRRQKRCREATALISAFFGRVVSHFSAISIHFA
jgi:hypothetical protein